MKALIVCWVCLLCPGWAAAQQCDRHPPSEDSGRNGSFICSLQESVPDYPGGSCALKKFIRKNTALPDSLKELQGRVMIRFDILENGTIIHACIMRSLHPVADSIALDMTRRMPRWKPGTWSGKPVRTQFILPVTFLPE